MGFWSDLFGGANESSITYSAGDESKWDGPDIDGAAARPDGHTTVYGNDGHTSWDTDKFGQPDNVHSTDHGTREITQHPDPPEWTKP